MKNLRFSNLIACLSALLFVLTLTACSGANKDQAMLADKAVQLNMDFNASAKQAPDFIDALSCEYTAPNLLINLKLRNDINPEMYSQALVEYVVANYIRTNPGELMDAIINGINRTKGSLSITIYNANEEGKEYTISHARLVQLVQKKNMELNFNDVKENVEKLMALDCNEFAEAVNAESCTFELSKGFAQYTLAFKNARAFANQTQGTILGRYLPVMKAKTEAFGSYSYLATEILKSLQIDGYRFVFTDVDESKKLSSAIPWKML